MGNIRWWAKSLTEWMWWIRQAGQSANGAVLGIPDRMSKVTVTD